jgi:hypothetical protein
MSVISVPAAASIVSLLLFAAASPAQDSELDRPSSTPPAAVQSTDSAPPPTAPAQTSVSAPAAQAGMSKVRIVRLSEVRGTVEVDRDTGRGFEPAMNNLPIVERCEVRTGAGIAEVEFEDNSTLRLAPNSAVAFPLLERLATGATVSEAQLLQGTAYVSLPKNSANGLTLLFGSAKNLEKLQFSPGSHVRLESDATTAKLAVFGGAVHLTGPDGDMVLPDKRTVDVSLAAAGEPKVTKQIAEESFDSWDKQSSEYHARVASLSAVGNAPYAYGTNDLAYYGSFMNAGGCGTMWRPYFASAAWDPYANGAWAWYPNAGYSWVSPYPWGWMPYHYGSWSFCPGMGWGWMPGGAWNGLMNTPAVTGTAGSGSGGGFIGVPRAPIHPPMQPPGPRQPTLLEVNMRPLVTSTMGTNNSFVFRRDSAGLGIPREGLGKLEGFSHSTVQHGLTTTPVYLTAGPAGGLPGRGNERMAAGSNLAPVMIHRGAAPPPMSTSRSMESGSGWAGQSTSSGGTSASGSSSSMSSAPVSSGSVSHGSMGGSVGSGGGAAPRAGGGGGRPQ